MFIYSLLGQQACEFKRTICNNQTVLDEPWHDPKLPPLSFFLHLFKIFGAKLIHDPINHEKASLRHFHSTSKSYEFIDKHNIYIKEWQSSEYAMMAKKWHGLPVLSNSSCVHVPLLCQGQLKTAPLSVTDEGVWSEVFALGAPTSMFNL